jgi:hypothetical protein
MAERFYEYDVDELYPDITILGETGDAEYGLPLDTALVAEYKQAQRIYLDARRKVLDAIHEKRHG